MGDFDYQVLKLTHNFYTDYPKSKYPELMRKQERPYTCLLIQSHYGYFICVPYRSDIQHKYAFMFHNSARSRQTSSGLDYSKAVIIDGADVRNYLTKEDALIDKDEYIETRDHIQTIAKDVIQYIDDYVSCCNGVSKLSSKEFSRRYKYSTLQYFHQQLSVKDMI